MQQPGFLDDLRRMSARVGANILLVQGAGGNSSVKRDDVLWVKASGRWLSEAKGEGHVRAGRAGRCARSARRGQ
jgi:rhamnose utilization protein RhaD (predicted bifunctional aldolase and dehydrogenase)